MATTGQWSQFPFAVIPLPTCWEGQTGKTGLQRSGPTPGSQSPAQLSSVGSGSWLSSGTFQCQHLRRVSSSDSALRGPMSSASSARLSSWENDRAGVKSSGGREDEASVKQMVGYLNSNLEQEGEDS